MGLEAIRLRPETIAKRQTTTKQRVLDVARSARHAAHDRIRRTLPEQARATWSVECTEAAIGVLIVTVIGFVLPGHWGLLDIQPHPLWAVVLAVAVRYGLPAGYVAGGLSAASYLLLTWLAPGQRFEALSASDLVQPFLFVAGGALVGEVAQARQRRLTRAEQQAGEAAARLEEVVGRYRDTLEVKTELEKRIANQPASVVTLYETAKRLESLNTDELYPAILDLLTEYLGVEACALYLNQGGRYLLHAERPMGLGLRATTLDAPSTIIGQAIREQRVVTLRDQLRAAGPDAVEREPVLMAGPLLDRDGAVQGLIVIERMPFLKFSPTSVRLFGLILDWASTALGNAAMFEQAVVRAVDHDLTGAYTPSHTLRCLRDEFLRAKRYGLPLSVVVVQVNDFARVAPERAPELLRTLGEVFRRCLREVDVIGHHTEADSFVLVLPMTGLEGARVIAQRIGAELTAAEPRPYGDHRPLSVRFGVSGLTGPETGAEVFDPAAGEFRTYAASAALPSLLPPVTACWRDQDARDVRDEEPAA